MLLKLVCIHIGNRSCDNIANYFLPKMYFCGCLTLNEIYILLTPLIICSISGSLINTSTWSKKKSAVVNLIILSTWKVLPFTENLRMKFLTGFKGHKLSFSNNDSILLQYPLEHKIINKLFIFLLSIKELENKVTFFHFSCSRRMLSSTYLLFESIKLYLTETNFRMTSPSG